MADIPTETEIRSEIGAILDELRRLPGDAYAEKTALKARQAELSKLLTDLSSASSVDIKRRWDALAGSKPGVPDPVVIPSPGEDGGVGF